MRPISLFTENASRGIGSVREAGPEYAEAERRWISTSADIPSSKPYGCSHLISVVVRRVLISVSDVPRVPFDYTTICPVQDGEQTGYRRWYIA